METSRLMDRLMIGKLEYEQIFFMFMKLDVVEPIQLAKDTIELRDGYDKQFKGYLKQTPGGVVIGQEEVKEGNYIGRYAKIKMNREGLDFYIEYKMFVLNDDVYTIQIVYPPSIENTTTDLRKRFLNSLIIASTAKQVK
jgi:hypothetical protein